MAQDFRLRTVADWAVIGIFTILAFWVLAAARDFLMPVTLAVLLFFVFTPFRRALHKRGIPQWVAAMIVTAGLVTLLVGIVLMMLGPAGDLIDSAPGFASKIEAKLRELSGPLQRLQLLAARIDLMTGGGGAAPSEGSNLIRSAMSIAPFLLTQVVFVLILLFFMMSTGELLYLKIVQSFPSLGTKRQAYAALRTIEASLGSYLSTITVINFGLAVAIGVAMWSFGMPAPGFLALVAFGLNFIPYLGSVAGTLAAFVIALVSLNGFLPPLMVAGTYIALTAIEGQLITPALVSRRLAMNSVAVFLAVAFWAWLWSVVGMIVAVPLLVVMRVLCDHIPGLERLGNFLGGEDPPPIGPEAAPPEPESLAAETPAEPAA
jgi:predicted PurR-regulated permease PerM